MLWMSDLFYMKWPITAITVYYRKLCSTDKTKTMIKMLHRSLLSSQMRWQSRTIFLAISYLNCENNTSQAAGANGRKAADEANMPLCCRSISVTMTYCDDVTPRRDCLSSTRRIDNTVSRHGKIYRHVEARTWGLGSLKYGHPPYIHHTTKYKGNKTVTNCNGLRKKILLYV